MRLKEFISPEKLNQFKKEYDTNNDELSSAIMQWDAIFGGGGKNWGDSDEDDQNPLQSNDSNSFPSSGDKFQGNIPSFSTGKYKVNPNEISSYLKSKGMSNNHVIGMMINIKEESSFDSGAVNGSSKALGLFQYLGSRKVGMLNHCGKDWANDWKGQIDYALSEPEGRQYLNMNFRNPFEAMKWFLEKFERPSEKDQYTRIAKYNVPQFTKVA